VVGSTNREPCQRRTGLRKGQRRGARRRRHSLVRRIVMSVLDKDDSTSVFLVAGSRVSKTPIHQAGFIPSFQSRHGIVDPHDRPECGRERGRALGRGHNAGTGARGLCSSQRSAQMAAMPQTRQTASLSRFLEFLLLMPRLPPLEMPLLGPSVRPSLPAACLLFPRSLVCRSSQSALTIGGGRGNPQRGPPKKQKQRCV